MKSTLCTPCVILYTNAGSIFFYSWLINQMEANAISPKLYGSLYKFYDNY